MDKSYFFDRNLLALSQRNPRLCSKLTAAETTHNHYKFLESGARTRYLPGLIPQVQPTLSTQLLSRKKKPGGSSTRLRAKAF